MTPAADSHEPDACARRVRALAARLGAGAPVPGVADDMSSSREVTLDCPRELDDAACQDHAAHAVELRAGEHVSHVSLEGRTTGYAYRYNVDGAERTDRAPDNRAIHERLQALLASGHRVWLESEQAVFDRAGRTARVAITGRQVTALDGWRIRVPSPTLDGALVLKVQREVDRAGLVLVSSRQLGQAIEIVVECARAP